MSRTPAMTNSGWERPAARGRCAICQRWTRAIPLSGDFNGDGTTDIIWFQPGVGADSMWQFHNGCRPRSP